MVVMAETSKDVSTQVERNMLSVEYLNYYKHMITDLLSRSEDFIGPFPTSDSMPSGSGKEAKDDNSRAASVLFCEGMVDGISDFKKERLKGLLSESITSLHNEVDEILDSILATFHIEAAVKEHLESPQCDGKQSILSCSACNHFGRDALDAKASQSRCSQVYTDFQGFVEKGMQPKEALEKCSNAISNKLGWLEHFVEEYLDISLSKCRPMTNAEKQQLGQKIHRLPMNALDRVAEMVQNRKPSTSQEIIHVNLDKEDDVTLWRLYCYVEAVAKASKERRHSRSSDTQFPT